MKPAVLRLAVMCAVSCAATALMAAASATTAALQEPKAEAPAPDDARAKPEAEAVQVKAVVVLPAVKGEVRKEDVKAQEPAAEVKKDEAEPVVEQEAIAVDVAIMAAPAVAAPAQGEGQGGEAEQLDPELLQYVQQLRPILRAELHRLRLVTKAGDDQIKAIAADGNKAVIAAARVIVKQMRGGMQRLKDSADPVDAIGEELEKIAKAHLTPEQQTQYAAERRKQVARQRRSAARLLVGALDEELGLTTDQRRQILTSIEENWQDGWLRVLAVAQYGRQYYPPLSDEVVTPHLNERQKKLWSEQKRQYQQIFGFFWHSNFDNSGLEPAVDDQVIQQGVGVPAQDAVGVEAVVEEEVEVKDDD